MTASFDTFPSRGFQIVPAIDLMGGQAVRLWQGDYETAHSVGEDPVAVARGFVAAGASRVHLVDLDGARAGGPANMEVIARIVEAVNVPVQVGGGVRAVEHLEALFDLGVHQVILGTVVMEEFDTFVSWAARWPKRLIVGLDARGGKLAKRGWLDDSGEELFDFAKRVAAHPIAGIVYTDILRDGTSRGPNTDNTRALARLVHPVPVLASGGVGTIDHLLELKPMSSDGIVGAIVGKAIYNGSVDLEQANEILNAHGSSGAIS